MAGSLFDLIAKREDLERQIRDAKTSEKSDAIAQVRKLMADHGLTTADLTATTKRARQGAKVAPKYRDPESGATWTGRGLKPRWLATAIAAGRSPDEFSI